MRSRSDDSGPLSPQVLYILLALLDEPRHGYGIMKDIEERTAGEVTLLPTSLYATIKRMRAEGLIEEAPDADVPETSSGRGRRAYGITADGREAAARELRRMSTLLEVADAKQRAGETA